MKIEKQKIDTTLTQAIRYTLNTLKKGIAVEFIRRLYMEAAHLYKVTQQYNIYHFAMNGYKENDDIQYYMQVHHDHYTHDLQDLIGEAVLAIVEHGTDTKEIYKQLNNYIYRQKKLNFKKSYRAITDMQEDNSLSYTIDNCIDEDALARDLINKIQKIARLTKRETQVLSMLYKFHYRQDTIKATAEVLKITPQTVSIHKTNIKAKCEKNISIKKLLEV